MQQETGQHQQLTAVRSLFLKQVHRGKRQPFLEYAFIERERLYVSGLRETSGRAFLPQGIQLFKQVAQFCDP